MLLSGRAQDRYLEPIRDFSRYEGVLKKYYQKVLPLLHTGFCASPQARYTVIPSFSPEYSFSFERKNGRCFLQSNSLSSNYWYSKAREFVRVKKRRVELSPEFYAQVSGLFALLTSQARPPEENPAGLDGITYYFAATDGTGHLLAGETWSPSEGSLLAEAVRICDRIHRITNRTDSAAVAALNGDIDALVKKLKE